MYQTGGNIHHIIYTKVEADQRAASWCVNYYSLIAMKRLDNLEEKMEKTSSGKVEERIFPLTNKENT